MTFSSDVTNLMNTSTKSVLLDFPQDHFILIHEFCPHQKKAINLYIEHFYERRDIFFDLKRVMSNH